MARRLWVSIFALLCVGLGRADAQTTALYLEGDGTAGLVTYGIKATYTPADSSFQILSFSPGQLRIKVDGPAAPVALSWIVSLSAPAGSPLQVGTYDATQWPYTQFGGLSIIVNGPATCHGLPSFFPEQTGRFVVREIQYSGNTLERLAIDFEQRCSNRDPALFGAIRYNSTISSLIPFGGTYPDYRLEVAPTVNGRVTGAGLNCQGVGPACSVTFIAPVNVTLTATPDPGYMFAGWSGTCHGSATITTTIATVERCSARFVSITASEPRLLFLNSNRDDSIGQGHREIYNTANSIWTLTALASAGVSEGVRVSLSSSEEAFDVSWQLDFRGPPGVPLAPGTYQVTLPSSGPSMDVRSVAAFPRGCRQPTGEFIVHEIELLGNTVSKLAIDFVQLCPEFALPPKPLSGSIRINSSVPARPTVALKLREGGGIVFSPSGATCTSNCAVGFDAGTEVEMTPVPAPGYWLFGWNGEPDCSDGAITMVAPIACEPLFRTLVSPDSVTGDGTSTTFEFSSATGGADIVTAWVRVFWMGEPPTLQKPPCVFYYERGTPPRFYLQNDFTASYQSGLAGSATILRNSACAIDLARSGATISGNVLRVTVVFTFVTGQNIDMRAVNSSGVDSGWVYKGSGWGTTKAVMTTDPVSPQNGSGSQQTFSLSYSDSFGATDLTQGWVWFTQAFGSVSANSCLAYYDRPANRVFLLNDAGNTWNSVPVGSTAVLENSQCGIYGSTVVIHTATRLTVNLAVRFKAFAGAKQVWLFAKSASATSGWQQRGNWTAEPSIVSAGVPAPDAGSGSVQSFSLPFSSSLGVADLSELWVWFNETLAASAAGSCLLSYAPATNTLRLLNDSGTVWQQGQLGVGGTLQNGQCAVSLLTSAVVSGGGTLTLNVSMMFKPSFGGRKNIYLFASGVGATSGWLDRGDWMVPLTVTADAASPDSGQGAVQTFTLSYSSTSGAADLTSAWAWFHATLATSAADSCLIYYEPSSSRLFLLNNAGTTWMSGTTGSASVLQNSQCHIALGASHAVLNGNTLTLTVAVTFSATFVGAKNIYMFAAGSGGTKSGWQDRGDWIVPSSVGADSVTPGSGNGMAETFALTYSSLFGADTLTRTWVWFNSTFATSAAGSCLVHYEPPTHKLSLLNDAGTVWQSATLGAGPALQNAQCSIDVSRADVSTSGNTLTLMLPITFAPAFAGEKNIYMFGASADANSGWQDRGGWTASN